MWQALRDAITSAKESLGIEVPDVGAATDVVSGAGDAVAGAGEQVTSKLTDFLGRLGG